MASSVAFIFRFNSILSSSAPRVAAMVRCSRRGGEIVSSKLGTSRHLRLLNTAPTFMKFSICSHHSGVLTNQRRKGGSTRLPFALSKTRFWPSANSVPVSSIAVTPGLVRRERTTSFRWYFVFRFQVTKSASYLASSREVYSSTRHLRDADVRPPDFYRFGCLVVAIPEGSLPHPTASILASRHSKPNPRQPRPDSRRSASASANCASS